MKLFSKYSHYLQKNHSKFFQNYLQIFSKFYSIFFWILFKDFLNFSKVSSKFLYDFLRIFWKISPFSESINHSFLLEIFSNLLKNVPIFSYDLRKFFFKIYWISQNLLEILRVILSYLRNFQKQIVFAHTEKKLVSGGWNLRFFLSRDTFPADGGRDGD